MTHQEWMTMTFVVVDQLCIVIDDPLRLWGYLTLAFRSGSKYQLWSSSVSGSHVKILSTASGMSGMISGQMKDIASEKSDDYFTGNEIIIRRN